MYSDAIVDELLIYYTNEEIKQIFADSKKENLLLKIAVTYTEKTCAMALSKKLHLPFMDCLHALLAKNNNAIIVTRDHHFEEMQNIVTVKKPEDLL